MLHLWIVSSLDFIMSMFWRAAIKSRVLEGGDTTSWHSNQKASLPEDLSRTKKKKLSHSGLGHGPGWDTDVGMLQYVKREEVVRFICSRIGAKGI